MQWVYPLAKNPSLHVQPFDGNFNIVNRGGHSFKTQKGKTKGGIPQLYLLPATYYFEFDLKYVKL